MARSRTKGPDASKPADSLSPGKQPGTDQSPSHKLVQQTHWFLSDIECLRELFREVLPILKQRDEQRTAEYKQLLSSIDTQIKQKPKGKDLIFVLSQLQSVLRVTRKLQAARRLFTGNVLLTLVARFEQLQREMLICVFEAYPDRLKGADEGISYEDVVAAGTLEDLKTKLIAKQVDQICGNSYFDLAKYFSELLCDKIHAWELWPVAVETYERRHAHAHSGGTITAKYLRLCRSHGVKLPEKTALGDPLPVDDDYFHERFEAFYVMAVRTSQVLFRKQFPKELGYADSALQEIGYELMKSDEWSLARSIFGFAVSLPVGIVSGDQFRRLAIINYCISLNALGEHEAVKKQIAGVDWTACASQFRLAVAVLNHDYAEAGRLMLTMRKDDPIIEAHYREWPLFREFRSTANFRRAFKKLYRRDFDHLTKQAVSTRLSSEDIRRSPEIGHSG
jgi:hypothetical protein